jgi:hypothetical protein
MTRPATSRPDYVACAQILDFQSQEIRVNFVGVAIANTRP